ncbi:MAG TPA: hypothetical protein VHL79_21990 [Ramlibacter sp.]|jgi:hypothetical protein|nr:hypothetical protein [Ramlibacter sp.]
MTQVRAHTVETLFSELEGVERALASWQELEQTLPPDEGSSAFAELCAAAEALENARRDIVQRIEQLVASTSAASLFRVDVLL